MVLIQKPINGLFSQVSISIIAQIVLSTANRSFSSSHCFLLFRNLLYGVQWDGGSGSDFLCAGLFSGQLTFVPFCRTTGGFKAKEIKREKSVHSPCSTFYEQFLKAPVVQCTSFEPCMSCTAHSGTQINHFQFNSLRKLWNVLLPVKYYILYNKQHMSKHRVKPLFMNVWYEALV